MGPVLGVVTVARGVRAGQEHLCPRPHDLPALDQALCPVLGVHMLDGRGVDHKISEPRRDDFGHLGHVAQLPADLERIIGCKVFGFEVAGGCAPHRLFDVGFADVDAGIAADVLGIVSQQRQHQRPTAADIHNVPALFGHLGGRKVLDIVHHVQVGKEPIPELQIKIPHLVGGAENLFPVHPILDAVDDFFTHAIFLSYQGISGT